jgi:hypothetical protein
MKSEVIMDKCQCRYNVGFMSQLDILGRYVSQKIKTRGRQYFNRRAVQILFADAEFVYAQVSANMSGQLFLNWKNRDICGNGSPDSPLN